VLVLTCLNVSHDYGLWIIQSTMKVLSGNGRRGTNPGVSRLFCVSSLAYPNLLGTKGYVVGVGVVVVVSWFTLILLCLILTTRHQPHVQ
jgi:hypothetical protein